VSRVQDDAIYASPSACTVPRSSFPTFSSSFPYHPHWRAVTCQAPTDRPNIGNKHTHTGRNTGAWATCGCLGSACGGAELGRAGQRAIPPRPVVLAPRLEGGARGGGESCLEVGGREFAMMTRNDGVSCLYMSAQSRADPFTRRNRSMLEAGGRELMMPTMDNGASCLSIARPLKP
jgi:hypothetical protein